MVNQPSAHPVRAELSPQDLFDRHQNVAHNIANHWVKRRPRLWELKEEIDQAALCGLWDAAQRYDATRGRTFNTFASHRCKGAILDYLRTLWGRAGWLTQTQFEHECVSLDAYMQGSRRTPHLRTHEPPAPVQPDRLLLADQVRWLLQALNERDAQIVAGYYMDGLKMSEVAARAGISESRISQILPDLVQRLKERSHEQD